MWPLVCAESWELLSIFLRVSWKQLPEYQQLPLLALVTGQLAIAGQLGRKVYLWSIGLLLGSGGWK